MIKIYGSMLCKDCVQCRQELDDANVSYIYLDFSEDLKYLKEFLAMRDTLEIFEDVKRNGAIGIPCIVDDNGTVSLNWEQYL